jgi:hypothetical protein
MGQEHLLMTAPFRSVSGPRPTVDERRAAVRYWFLLQLTLSAAAWGTIALLLSLAA